MRLQDYHGQVKDYLFTGVGLDLQNDDARIMENILMDLHKRGIIGLPVHDSVIVENEHADLLAKLSVCAWNVINGYLQSVAPGSKAVSGASIAVQTLNHGESSRRIPARPTRDQHMKPSEIATVFFPGALNPASG